MTAPTLHDTPGSTSAESLGHRLLSVLYQHRMATSDQLSRLLAYASTRDALLKLANRLRVQGLVDRVAQQRPGRTWVWFLTTRGIDEAANWPELVPRARYSAVQPRTAALHSAHTLTVLRTHLAFAADAAAWGDEHGPLDWLPEVVHRLPEVGEDRLRPDALMYYTTCGNRGRTKLRAFVEVDRGLMSSERLSRKLINYARFHSYIPGAAPGRRAGARAQSLPAWQNFYPRYPRVLFVLTGTGKLGFSNRLADLRSMVSGHPLVASFAERVPIGACQLEALEIEGASAPVWWPLGQHTEQAAWLEL